MRGKRIVGGKVPYLYLLPAILIFTVFLAIPIVQSLYYSFYDYNGMTAMKFTGLDNYARVFQEINFSNALKNTIIFTVLNVVIQNVIAIPLAVLLNGKIRFKSFFKSLVFFPAVLSMVVVGFVFQFILNPAYGSLNEFLTLIGLESLTRNWLGDVSIALYAVIFVTCWQGLGYATVIYLGGLQGIPNEINEAAQIDGSGRLNTFFRITFPMLAPVFTISVTLSAIVNIKEFDRIYIMTGGGPAGATEVVVTYLYRTFHTGYLGYGSAIAVILFILLMMLTFVQTKLLSYRENF